jgi:hypothetical protein
VILAASSPIEPVRRRRPRIVVRGSGTAITGPEAAISCRASRSMAPLGRRVSTNAPPKIARKIDSGAITSMMLNPFPSSAVA